jgi:hypothetical protein
MERLSAAAMKLYKRSARPISCERGSIVLEAALVMPVLMLALLAFIIMIRLCAVQMALHSATSQTARQIAAHMRPVELAWLQTQTAAEPSLFSPSGRELPPWSEAAAQAAEWLPEPVGELASSALRGDWQPLQTAAATELGRAAVEPLLRQFADKALLSPERLRLSGLTLPDLGKNREPLLAIAAQYEFPLKLPFSDKPIILQEQAVERVWISDAAPAQYGSQAGQEGEPIPLQIVSIEPRPLRPGRKATVIVRTAPTASVTLGVTYKSGASVAKHLGAAVADADGYIAWTWHVSGNTTTGVWQLTVAETGNEANAVSMHFQVERFNAASE